MIIGIVIYILLMVLIVSVLIGWDNSKKEADKEDCSTDEPIKENFHFMCHDIVTGVSEDISENDACIGMGVLPTQSTYTKYSDFGNSSCKQIVNTIPYVFIDNITEYKWLWDELRLNGDHILRIKNLIKIWKESGLKTKDEVYCFMFRRRFNKIEEDKDLDVCVRIDDEFVKFDFRKQFGDNYNRIFYKNLLDADSGLQINYSNCSHFRRMENDYIYSENNVPVKVYSRKDIEDKIKFYGEKE